MLRLNTKIHKLLNNITSKWKSLSDCMLNTQRYLLKKKKNKCLGKLNSLQLIMEEMKIANLKQEEERKLDRLMLTESRNMLRIMGIEIKYCKK